MLKSIEWFSDVAQRSRSQGVSRHLRRIVTTAISHHLHRTVTSLTAAQTVKSTKMTCCMFRWTVTTRLKCARRPVIAAVPQTPAADMAHDLQATHTKLMTVRYCASCCQFWTVSIHQYSFIANLHSPFLNVFTFGAKNTELNCCICVRTT